MRETIEQLFPRLRSGEFQITSPVDHRYNCVAWAAGDINRWWWPSESPFAYWPPGLSREDSIDSFIVAFASLGYEPATSEVLEPEVEKIAIFASEAAPTHMARQLDDGTWTSKLGQLEDIAHDQVDALAGGDYGTVVICLKRRRTLAG